MTIWLYKSFGFRILTEITPMSFLCETVFIQMWFDCLLREQFLQALSSWKENCFLGPKKKQPVHSASACWAIAGLARNRSSSCGASWVLLTSEWTSVGLTVPPWRPHSAGPLGLLPGPGEHLGCGLFFEGRVLRSLGGRVWPGSFETLIDKLFRVKIFIIYNHQHCPKGFKMCVWPSSVNN